MEARLNERVDDKASEFVIRNRDAKGRSTSRLADKHQSSREVLDEKTVHSVLQLRVQARLIVGLWERSVHNRNSVDQGAEMIEQGFQLPVSTTAATNTAKNPADCVVHHSFAVHERLRPFNTVQLAVIHRFERLPKDRTERRHEVAKVIGRSRQKVSKLDESGKVLSLSTATEVPT